MIQKFTTSNCIFFDFFNLQLIMGFSTRFQSKLIQFRLSARDPNIGNLLEIWENINRARS
jgi:hypothetical protein